MSDKAKNILLIIEQLKAEGCSDEEIVDLVEDDVIECKDPELSYHFLVNYYEYVDYLDHAYTIINSGNARFNYLTALHYPCIYSFDHEKALLKANDPLYSYKFARDVEPLWGIYLKIPEDIIAMLDSELIDLENVSTDNFRPNDEFIPIIKNAYEKNLLPLFFDDMKIYIYDFNIDAHRDVVFKSGKKELIKAFKRDVDEKRRTTKL